MSAFAIAWRGLRTRPVQTALTALIVALGVGLALVIVVLAGGLRRGIRDASGPFELVVGPKGSSTQLVMSTVLLQDVPLGNIDYQHYQELRTNPLVKDAVPVALGDNIHGVRIVGTTPTFFEVAVTPDRPPFYRLAQGRPFAADFEAVVGSIAAARLGLRVEQEFISAHGATSSLNADDHPDDPYHVVGILAPTGTPADLGVYVPLSSYWKSHTTLEASIFDAEQLEAELASDTLDTFGVTAVLVRARDLSASYQLYQQLNTRNDVQAALPGMVLVQLLNYVGQGQRMLTVVTGVALGMAALSVAVALFGAVLARHRDIAVLRAIGASRRTVLAIVLWETVLTAVLGSGLGMVIAHGAAQLLGLLLIQRSALAARMGFEVAEVPIVMIMLLLGVVAGVLPAIRAYRVEPATVLAGVS